MREATDGYQHGFIWLKEVALSPTSAPILRHLLVVALQTEQNEKQLGKFKGHSQD